MKKEDRIGLIGSGMLGNAVGLRLLQSGYSLTAYNRTKEKTLELQKNGAILVDTPEKVAQSSDLIIICVKDASAVKDVSFEKNGILLGSHENLVVADMSTVNPLESRKITNKFKESGISKLDIPVMGGPDKAIKGDLVLMASGEKDVFDKCKKVFENIAHEVFFLGESGIAHSVKLSMNLQIAMLALAISEGIILSRASKVEPKVFLEILNSTYFKTGMSENKAYKMIQ